MNTLPTYVNAGASDPSTLWVAVPLLVLAAVLIWLNTRRPGRKPPKRGGGCDE